MIVNIYKCIRTIILEMQDAYFPKNCFQHWIMPWKKRIDGVSLVGTLTIRKFIHHSSISCKL